MKIKWIYAGAIICMILIIIGFFYREARNEVFYLCQSFSEGMPKVIVEEQLSTAEFSRVREIHKRKLVMDSAFNLYVHHCHIEFSLDRKVSSVQYDSF
ncbi:MAG: hypothetical protein AAGJ37_03545 [Pseudomonadota bacterium]